MRAVNLLPRDEAKRRKVQMTVGTQLALVAPFVIASLIVAGFLLESSKINDNRATLKALQGELAALPPPVASTPQADNTQLALQQSQRISALSTALQSRVAWDRILREISSVLPEDVWLTTLSAASPTVTAPPPPPPPPPTTTEGSGGVAGDANGETTTTTPAPAPAPAAPVGTGAALNLAGFTYSQEGVARFLGRLSVIPELQNVKLVSSTSSADSGREVVQFTITAEIRSQAAA